MSIIAHVVAMAKNGVIGDSKTNSIPWHHKEDFKHFKKLTLNSSVVMGGKTWDSLPKKPLPGRVNVIISKDYKKTQTDEVVRIFNSIDHGIRFALSKTTIMTDVLPIDNGDEIDNIVHLTGNVYIIGGGQIYAKTIDLVNRVYLTVLDNEYQGDIVYPCLDQINDEFDLIDVVRFESNDGEVCTYQRKVK